MPHDQEPACRNTNCDSEYRLPSSSMPGSIHIPCEDDLIGAQVYLSWVGFYCISRVTAAPASCISHPLDSIVGPAPRSARAGRETASGRCQARRGVFRHPPAPGCVPSCSGITPCTKKSGREVSLPPERKNRAGGYSSRLTPKAPTMRPMLLYSAWNVPVPTFGTPPSPPAVS